MIQKINEKQNKTKTTTTHKKNPGVRTDSGGEHTSKIMKSSVVWSAMK